MSVSRRTPCSLLCRCVAGVLCAGVQFYWTAGAHAQRAAPRPIPTSIPNRHTTGYTPAPVRAPVATPPGVSRPIPDNPALGIWVAPFRMNTPLGAVDGVRVTADRARRPLYARRGGGGWQRFRFRVGWDVIQRINGTPVRTANDVRIATQFGWNTLHIWDRATGSVGDYSIHLP